MYHFDFMVDGLEDLATAEELLDAIIDWLDGQGAMVAGGMHKAGACDGCTDDEADDGG